MGDASRREDRWPEPVVRGDVMHVLWRQHFTVDWAALFVSRTSVDRVLAGLFI